MVVWFNYASMEHDIPVPLQVKLKLNDFPVDMKEKSEIYSIKLDRFQIMCLLGVTSAGYKMMVFIVSYIASPPICFFTTVYAA
jgi:hypothetical protein